MVLDPLAKTNALKHQSTGLTPIKPPDATTERSPIAGLIQPYTCPIELPIAALSPSPNQPRLPAFFKLDEVLGDARIIGLGEASHGVREFQQWKIQIIRDRVLNKNARMLFFESPLQGGRMIDDFIMSRTATPVDEVMKSFGYWMWKTEEVRDLILWLKEYNSRCDNGKDKVRFVAIDGIGSGNVAFLIDDMLKATSSLRHQESFIALAKYIKEFDRLDVAFCEAIGIGDRANAKAIYNTLRQYMGLLQNNRRDAGQVLVNYADGVDNTSKEFFWLCSIALDGWFERAELFGRPFETAIAESFFLATPRDRSLARVVSEVMQRLPPDVTSLVWAHDEHVGRIEREYHGVPARSMGAFLQDAALTYSVLGFDMVRGSELTHGATKITPVGVETEGTFTGNEQSWNLAYILSMIYPDSGALLNLRPTRFPELAQLDNALKYSRGSTGNPKDPVVTRSFRSAFDAILAVHEVEPLKVIF